jgi:CelD/BcsL family acetyltransferase involved in cellulose biosynthesis
LPPSWYPPEALRPARPQTWLHCVSRAQHEACPANPSLLEPIENGVPVAALVARHAKRNFALILGRICPEKGIHLAIEAAKQADVGLLIAGQVFGYEAHGRYFAEEVAPRLDRARRFIGPIGFARKRRLLTAARCLLVPSTVPETSSLVAREALACGTPVVAFPSGALLETVEHGRTGFVVESVAEMASAIEGAPSIDPTECRRVACERFSIERMIERYLAVYHQLAGAAGRPPGRRSGIAARIIRSAAELEALEPAWWELWRRSRASTPFQSPAWLIPWWRHFHPGELMAAAAWTESRLVGLAPFYLEDGPYGRRLLPVGIAVTDHHDVLVDPRYEAEAAQALIDAFGGEPSWDALELEELPPHALALRLPRPSGCEELVLDHSPCPVLELRGPDLASFVPKAKRANLNTARNRATRRGAVTIMRAEGVSMSEVLDHLVRLHSLRWDSRGEDGVLADARVVAFHREAAPRLQAAGLLRLYTLGLDNEVVAALYGFHHAGRGYSYLTGFDPAYAFESPGLILLAHAIEQAMAEGAHEFHFLRGREAYKYEWGAVDRWNRRRSFRRIVAERSVA